MSGLVSGGLSVTVELPAGTFERIVEEVLRRLKREQVSAPRWLCGAEAAAAYLDWPVARVYKSLRQLPHSRDGRLLMFNTGDLDAHMRAGQESFAALSLETVARPMLARLPRANTAATAALEEAAR